MCISKFEYKFFVEPNSLSTIHKFEICDDRPKKLVFGRLDFPIPLNLFLHWFLQTEVSVRISQNFGAGSGKKDQRLLPLEADG